MHEFIFLQAILSVSRKRLLPLQDTLVCELHIVVIRKISALEYFIQSWAAIDSSVIRCARVLRIEEHGIKITPSTSRNRLKKVFG
jgi:hypothetical protein